MKRGTNYCIRWSKDNTNPVHKISTLFVASFIATITTFWKLRFTSLLRWKIWKMLLRIGWNYMYFFVTLKDLITGYSSISLSLLMCSSLMLLFTFDLAYLLSFVIGFDWNVDKSLSIVVKRSSMLHKSSFLWWRCHNLLF